MAIERTLRYIYTVSLLSERDLGWGDGTVINCLEDGLIYKIKDGAFVVIEYENQPVLKTINGSSILGEGNLIVAASIEIKDEGVSKTASAASIDFVGSGVNVTNTGSDVTVTINGGSGTFAISQVELDFGNNEDFNTSLFISDASVTATSKVVCSISAVATSDNTIEDILVSNISLMAGNNVNASGFTIYAYAPDGASGKFKVNYSIVY